MSQSLKSEVKTMSSSSSRDLKSRDLWLQATVIPGKRLGKILNFPTINLHNPNLLSGQKEGVYASRIKIKGKEYFGVLYYGPRLILGETKNVLEIFIFDFNQEIYGETISFQVKKYIRPVMNFSDTRSFQDQLKSDCEEVKKYFGPLH